MAKNTQTLTVNHSYRSYAADHLATEYTPGAVVLSIDTPNGLRRVVLRLANEPSARQLIGMIEHGVREMMGVRRTSAAKKAWATRRARDATSTDETTSKTSTPRPGVSAFRPRLAVVG